MISGAREVEAAFKRIAASSSEAAVRIIQRSSAVLESEAKKEFTEAHKQGTPTPSQPGTPPAVVTGTLRRSIRSDTPVKDGLGARGRVYPTAIYARIQELGGGRGLPPRPYMAPAYATVQPKMEAIAVEEWARVVRG